MQGSNNEGGGMIGSSKIDQAAPRSSFRSLGVDERIEKGTSGTRNTIADAKYAGDRKEGRLNNVSSATAGGKEMNAGSKNAPAASGTSKQYGAKDYGQELGTTGSRQSIAEAKYGGDRKVGKLVGRDAGKETQVRAGTSQEKSQYIGGPVADMDNTLRATGKDRSRLQQALRGISQKKGLNSNSNQRQ